MSSKAVGTAVTAVSTPRLHSLQGIPGKHSRLCPPNFQDTSPGETGKTRAETNKKKTHGGCEISDGSPVHPSVWIVADTGGSTRFDEILGYLGWVGCLPSSFPCRTSQRAMVLFVFSERKTPGQTLPWARRLQRTSMCVGSTCSCIKCSAEKVAALDAWTTSGAASATHWRPGTLLLASRWDPWGFHRFPPFPFTKWCAASHLASLG